MVHDTASRVIAQFLRDESLISCSVDDAVAMGVHALFFPHGVGHHLGMDVHDMENFGDKSAYPKDMGRPEQFGTRYPRLNLPIDRLDCYCGARVYIVDEILNNDALLHPFKVVPPQINWTLGVDLVEFESRTIFVRNGS